MNLKIAGIVFAAIGLLGFFLPWMKLLPSAPRANHLDVVQKMMARDSDHADIIYDYVLMNGQDANDAISSLSDGFSGFQLAMVGKTADDHEASSCLENYFFGERKIDWKIKLLWLLPTLTLLGLAALLIPYGRMGSLSVALALIGMYGLVRWEMTTASQIYLEASYGIGLWLTLYAAISLGIICLIQAIRSGSQTKGRRR